MERDITLQDCLQLGAFSDAEVICNQESLHHSVRCISVLDAHFDLALFQKSNTDPNMLYMVTDDFLKQPESFIQASIGLIAHKKGAGLIVFCKEPLSITLSRNISEYTLYKNLALIGIRRGNDVSFSVVIQSVMHLVLMGRQPADSLQGFFDLILYGTDNYTNRLAWQSYAKKNRINRVAFLFSSSTENITLHCSASSHFSQVEHFLVEHSVSARITDLSGIIAIAVSESTSISFSELLFPALLDSLNAAENPVSLLYLNVKFLINAESNSLIALSNHFYYLKAVFPYKSIYTYTDLLFVSECTQALDEERLSFTSCNTVLAMLEDEALVGKLNLIETLTVWLLDESRNTQTAAKILKLHPNTLQYRLKKIKETISVDFENTASLALLSFALGITRLRNKLK